MNIFTKVLRSVGACLGKHYPKAWISFRYFLRFHKILNLKNPKNLNEKILYLSLMTDTSQWTGLADKYRVRKYIEKCGYKDSLVTLYGMWEDADSINFESLPQSFVLKANHGSGDVKIIKDKSLINRQEIISYFKKIVNTPYGEIEAGKHYARIKPCIIAEELLTNDDESSKYSKSIIDYKCWCFNGICHYIWCCCNRDKHGTDVLLYDRNWIAHPKYSIFTSHYRRGIEIPRPHNLNAMIEMAEKLAKPFPCVRIDLYNISGKIYFGEMTFTSLGGMMNFYTDDFLNNAGSLIDINYRG